MLQALICRATGHQALCEQEATLYPGGGGTLHHRHECLRCGLTLHFEPEDLPNELETELREAYPFSSMHETNIFVSPQHGEGIIH